MSRAKDPNIVTGSQKIFRVIKWSLIATALIIILAIAAMAIYRGVSKNLTTASSQKTFTHQQVFEITVPSDSTVKIEGVLARKNDIIKFFQTGPPKEFFWNGRENSVRITTSVYYGKVWIGNDEENRELQIWVKGGKEGDVKLRVEIIPHP